MKISSHGGRPVDLSELFPEYPFLQKIARKRSVQVHLVGGSLRDLLTGHVVVKPGRDLDIAVSSGAIPLARLFAKAVKGSFVLLDQESGCARVAKKKNGALWTYDFADFRARTFKSDLSKRDFTINTFSVDLLACDADKPLLEQVKDHMGGQKDIERKSIRMTQEGVFEDDPLRLLRAYSLQAQLGFSIESSTLTRIKKDVKLIKKVSPERVREELFKVFDSSRTAAIMKAMDKVGLLAVIVPQIESMRAIEKGAYHHLNVWDHSLCAVSELERLLEDAEKDADLVEYLNEEVGGGHRRRALLKMACLLHDIGKPDTRRNEPDGRLSFHGHERVGRDIVRLIAKAMMMSTKERYALEDMVMFHLRPGYLSNFKKPSERMIFRFMRDAGEEAVSVLLLSVADQHATRGPLTSEEDVQHHKAIAFDLIDRFFKAKKEQPFVPLVNGHDLIREFKLKPGPDFAKILASVEEAQHLGRVTTKMEALALALKVAGL